MFVLENVNEVPDRSMIWTGDGSWVGSRGPKAGNSRGKASQDPQGYHVRRIIILWAHAHPQMFVSRTWFFTRVGGLFVYNVH